MAKVDAGLAQARAKVRYQILLDPTANARLEAIDRTIAFEAQASVASLWVGAAKKDPALQQTLKEIGLLIIGQNSLGLDLPEALLRKLVVHVSRLSFDGNMHLRSSARMLRDGDWENRPWLGDEGIVALREIYIVPIKFASMETARPGFLERYLQETVRKKLNDADAAWVSLVSGINTDLPDDSDLSSRASMAEAAYAVKARERHEMSSFIEGHLKELALLEAERPPAAPNARPSLGQDQGSR